MFVGCGCHCKREQVASIGASVSGEMQSFASSVTSITPIESASCSFCKYGVAAQVYEFEWHYSSTFATTKPCCSTYTTQTKYRLYRRALIPGYPPPSGYCLWASNEMAMTGSSNGQCVLIPNATARVVLSIGALLQAGFTGVRVNYMEFISSLPVATYQPSYVEYLFPPDWDANCLAPVTLTRKFANVATAKRWSLSRPFMFQNGYGSPCNTIWISGEDPGIPETVTIRPVAS